MSIQLNPPPYNNTALREDGHFHDSWNMFFKNIFTMFSPKSYYIKTFEPIFTGFTGTYTSTNNYIVDREFVHCQLNISGTGLSLTNAKITGFPDDILTNTCVNYAIYTNDTLITSGNLLLKTSKELIIPNLTSGNYQIYFNIQFLRNF